MPDIRIVLSVAVLLAGSACYAGVRLERWRAERARQVRGFARVLRQWQLIRESSDRATVAAFERAARAVTMWPHRTDRRMDLVRHLQSLAHAPELGAPAPNPAATPTPEAAATTSLADPAAAPVSARPVVPETQDPGPELNLMEGFL